jgi:hypothetical protein
MFRLPNNKYASWFVFRLPEGLEDVSTYPALFAELHRRGWTAENLRKLAGKNLIRVFTKVEQVNKICFSIIYLFIYLFTLLFYFLIYFCIGPVTLSRFLPRIATVILDPIMPRFITNCA